MTTYDWIVIGGGITGASLAYELRRRGCSVLLIEPDHPLQGATRYSYGGLAFWSGTSELTQQLCSEGMARYHQLTDELEWDIQFRELDLVLTIPVSADPQAAYQAYQGFAIPPQLLTPAEAVELEPLLDPGAIAGALTVRHGHILPEATTQGYRQAFERLGGVVLPDRVLELIQQGDRIVGVTTTQGCYQAGNTVVATGGLGRALLNQAGIRVPLYFTHAELIETPPLDLELRTLVMPADTQRFTLEANSTSTTLAPRWDEPDQEVIAPILDPGAIQFLDGRIRIGQTSRVFTTPCTSVDAARGEADLRTAIGTILPSLKDVPGAWHQCLVAFSSDRLPLVGAIAPWSGVHIFSGFSNPLVVVPPLAERFANHMTGSPDPLIQTVSPNRFS